ncbi:hypothetical protein E2C01_020155 [Portunus trituberculatus]|uniref:Uncharacterized protein n=1 Tax=Portunus trituberculatus TaxID=210409 RepID=A0A5B7E1B4_PORTR|nr:hypothetical protein [Portunus trituberculatus]
MQEFGKESPESERLPSPNRGPRRRTLDSWRASWYGRNATWAWQKTREKPAAVLGSAHTRPSAPVSRAGGAVANQCCGVATSWENSNVWRRLSAMRGGGGRGGLLVVLLVVVVMVEVLLLLDRCSEVVACMASYRVRWKPYRSVAVSNTPQEDIITGGGRGYCCVMSAVAWDCVGADDSPARVPHIPYIHTLGDCRQAGWPAGWAAGEQAI